MSDDVDALLDAFANYTAQHCETKEEEFLDLEDLLTHRDELMAEDPRLVDPPNLAAIQKRYAELDRVLGAREMEINELKDDESGIDD